MWLPEPIPSTAKVTSKPSASSQEKRHVDRVVCFISHTAPCHGGCSVAKTFLMQGKKYKGS
jgi:hypothetical protein